ncbi:hypothetical protein HELRODRAFT_171778 [Helobdella robusta]|uniref:Uncharacterized protein n=1 Tax=Helobdella robusta TaxID=6412 RepID=T1F4N6_HELRO|nr:hypothetical protein HELRODRAFT_171778 [Helobdella robusta]ESO05387.1 hypothetical protein HELRODRAFT_171778 [Helobdella robusta]
MILKSEEQLLPNIQLSLSSGLKVELTVEEAGLNYEDDVGKKQHTEPTTTFNKFISQIDSSLIYDTIYEDVDHENDNDNKFVLDNPNTPKTNNSFFNIIAKQCRQLGNVPPWSTFLSTAGTNTAVCLTLF